MITEDYVSFETVKLLREKGFKEPTLAYAYGQDMVAYYSQPKVTDDYNVEAGRYPLPTLQMAMKWLRKNHQIFIRPNTSFLYPIKWYSEIFCYGDNLKTQQDIKTEYYDSPEEACEAAIKYCLENLI
jgi:hypothetical protein